ncbi:hypothetical protein Sinac_5040 [Singulisphaera acidiphila DSM 18658]|uniref:Uncharacterized protein n=1 Tax=Singulisphaera acidiphila (strain ATCC BAA-1392 / DSM 18658 / VKM B-2454 / MOB10) TaxID=886293 RepID=L0DIH4_SINAD|nr:hypothetical protein Sinac_5040 [Singulisphaera acidiphila DSM 18658]
MVSRGLFPFVVADYLILPMQTNSVPEIEQSDLKAARDFLTSLRDEGRHVPPAHTPSTSNHNAARGTVTVRNGITRARTRSAAKTSA